MSRIACFVILVGCAATLAPLGGGGDVPSSEVGDGGPPGDGGGSTKARWTLLSTRQPSNGIRPMPL